MANFDENALLQQGNSAMDYFANESNQKNVLDEISAFGDEELNASFKRLFEASDRENDAYLTGSGKVTVEQISRFNSAPEPELQKDILLHSSKETVLLLLSKFRLCLAAEYTLLQRLDADVVLFYFERYPLYPTAQEYLVKKALKSDEYKELLLAYISYRALCSRAKSLLISLQATELLEAYVAKYPIGQMPIFTTCPGRTLRIDFVKQFLRFPLDKLTLALVIRTTPKFAQFRKYAWAYNVCSELEQLKGNDKVFFAIELSDDEAKFLVDLPETKLLTAYIRRFRLPYEAEEALLRRNLFELTHFYLSKYSIPFCRVELMVKEDLDKAFLAYAKFNKMSYRLFTLLQKSAHGKIKSLVWEQKLFTHIS